MLTSENIGFNDGSYIIYVNGAYRGDDPIGRLMHDFSCANADDMNYALMAERTRYLKDNPKGVAEMCRQMEEIRSQSALETKKEMAIEMYAEGLPVETIARIAKYNVEQVRSWLVKAKGK